MAALLFEIDGQRYGLDIAQVLKVLPMVRLRLLPHAPEYVAGIFRYQGKLVPVIDLSRLIRGKAVPALLSTRIILVRYPAPNGEARVLGLLAEKATDSLEEDVADAQHPGVAVPEAPYLGGLNTIGGVMTQHVKVEHLLPAELRERLFVEE
jgi:chemotaxis-related protein WspB